MVSDKLNYQNEVDNSTGNNEAGANFRYYVDEYKHL
jgi:hypothetical protein